MDSIKVLMTLRFKEELIDRVRAVSPRLIVVQKSVKENWDGMDPREFFDGDEEILYGFMPPRELAIAPKLKWVQLHSAGINHLLNSNHPVLQSDIKVTTSSGIHAVPIGEFVIATMLALARRVPRMVRMQNSGVWTTERWNTFLGMELRGATLGIIGYGSIGRHVARIAKHGFAMRVLAMTRGGDKRDRGYVEPGVGDPEGTLPDAWFTRAQLPDLLAQSDFVLIATPLTEETRNLIGERELRAMKATAFIVNVARGGIINEPALIRALKENWIAGAALDVFEKEPLPADSALWKLENALIAPHVSGATPHYDNRAIDLFCENIRRYMRGEELLNLVNREIGYQPQIHMNKRLDIKGVIFDLGWTLDYYDTNWNAINPIAYKNAAAFLEANGIHVAEDFATQFHAARERGWKHADETGIEQTVEDAIRQVIGPNGVTSLNGITPQAVRVFFAEHEKHWVAYADALSTIQELARGGLRLGLISNADDDGLVRRQIQRAGFEPYLSPVLSSAQEPRWRKPDPRIFHIVSDAWQIAPSNIVMVGDAPMYDVLGAHRASMKAIWIDRNEDRPWQKIPDALANDPAVRADKIVHALAEIPNMIEDW